MKNTKRETLNSKNIIVGGTPLVNNIKEGTHLSDESEVLKARNVPRNCEECLRIMFIGSELLGLEIYEH